MIVRKKKYLKVLAGNIPSFTYFLDKHTKMYKIGLKLAILISFSKKKFEILSYYTYLYLFIYNIVSALYIKLSF